MKKIFLLLFLFIYSTSYAQFIATHGMLAKRPTITSGSNLLPGYTYADLAHNYINGPLINTSNVWTPSEVSEYGIISYINTSYVGVNNALAFKYTTNTKHVSFELSAWDDFFGGEILIIEVRTDGVVEVRLRDISTEELPVQPAIGQFVRLKRLTDQVDDYTTFRVSIVDASENEIYGKDYVVRYAGSVTESRFRFQMPLSPSGEIAYPQIK
jgi:hypothetical protein